MKLPPIISLIKRKDYWSLSDLELLETAFERNIYKERIRNTKNLWQIIHQQPDSMFKIEELEDRLRSDLVNELVKRDNYIRNYVAIGIALLSLIVSGFALIK
jgi:hypothetical protein